MYTIRPNLWITFGRTFQKTLVRFPCFPSANDRSGKIWNCQNLEILGMIYNFGKNRKSWIDDVWICNCQKIQKNKLWENLELSDNSENRCRPFGGKARHFISPRYINCGDFFENFFKNFFWKKIFEILILNFENFILIWILIWIDSILNQFFFISFVLVCLLIIYLVNFIYIF